METPSDNPFQSPAVEASRRLPNRYPKLLWVAQACGLLIAALMLAESYIFPRQDVPWPYIVFWSGIAALVATVMMSIPNKIFAIFPLVYFQMIGFVSLYSWIIALPIAPWGKNVFFLIGALLCMVVVFVLFQKRTQTYYARRY